MTTYHKKLTAKAVENIKPPTDKGQQDEYYDTHHLAPRGFALRTGASGKKVFTQMYRFQGKVKRYTLKSRNLSDARLEGHKIRDMADNNIDPAAVKKRKQQANFTFKKLAEKYISEYARPNKRTWKEDQQKLEKKFSEWDEREADSITPEDVFDRIEYIKQNHGPIAANRNLALIRKLCKWAREKRLIKESPVRDISKNPERTRDKVLTDDEIKAVWEGCNAHGYPFGHCYKICLITGRRIGSVSGMKWADVDLEAQEWQIPSELDKSGKPQIVPLPDLAVDILKDIQKNYRIEKSEFVFTTNGKTPVSGFSKSKIELDKLSKVTGWTLHDLRRTCRTNLPRLGVTPDIAKLTIGHKLQGVDAVYDRWSYMPEKRDALDKWAGFIQGLIADKDSKVIRMGKAS
jgi:integrase